MATATLNVTNSNTITITLSSLATAGTATSSAIDNSTNKFLSANVTVKVKTGAASTSATGSWSVFVARSADGGSTYDDGKAFIGAISTIANATTYISTFSTESIGPLGSHWKLVVVNNGGGTSDTTAGNHSAVFAGIKYDVA
jgi:hypothetical protein